MTKIWRKKSQSEIKETVFSAIEQNVNYDNIGALGIPASFLDNKVFNQDSSFLKDAPFIYALVNNPNHIGCHTLGTSEPFFKGTHAIEKELIDICAIDILKGEEGMQDGYVASGGTEANIQAIWIYRNFYMQTQKASKEEILILCSEDSHYSMDKAANLLSLDIEKFKVQESTREIDINHLEKTIQKAKKLDKKHFIVVCNMMTTMFGSVDNINELTSVLMNNQCDFKLHVDGAYGGFYYPFTTEDRSMTFQNPHISSFTLDAHKMAQSPYGTGIFLIRKGLIKYVNTQEASYVKGEDYTLIGSRSGANAIAVWMILSKNGPYGWHEKVFILQKRTKWFCDKMDELNIKYYNNPYSNIITIRAQYVDPRIADKYGLVPDNHISPKWFKVVVMEHVLIEKLELLVKDLQNGI